MVLLKGKIIVLFSEDFRNLPQMDRDWIDRENRLDSFKEEDNDDSGISSIFSIYGKRRVSKLRQAIESITKSPLQFIISSDNINLAYRVYQPHQNSKANVIIIAWNSNHYDLMAQRLSKSYEISCYVFEVRGLGYSGG